VFRIYLESITEILICDWIKPFVRALRNISNIGAKLKTKSIKSPAPEAFRETTVLEFHSGILYWGEIRTRPNFGFRSEFPTYPSGSFEENPY
jgi:hypothetical protein